MPCTRGWICRTHGIERTSKVLYREGWQRVMVAQVSHLLQQVRPATLQILRAVGWEVDLCYWGDWGIRTGVVQPGSNHFCVTNSSQFIVQWLKCLQRDTDTLTGKQAVKPSSKNYKSITRVKAQPIKYNTVFQSNFKSTELYVKLNMLRWSI